MGNTIYAEYSEIVANSDMWFRFTNRKIQENININSLFKAVNSKNFIKQMFFNESLINLVLKVKFPEGREMHTVSAFLLGILFKDRLKLSTRSLPNPCKDSKKSFIYFWSMICLSHDLTFWIESRKEYLGACSTIEDFYEEFNITYRLGETSKYGKLFENYYRYCVEVREKIDHGITCGIVIYDQLMKQYSKNIEKNNVVAKDGWKYNKSFKEYALKISETIARHNLWVAEPKDEITYVQYQLYELISSSAKFKKVAYSEQDSLLFLLGLVDTLEPIKCCRRENQDCDVYDILTGIYIKCSSRNKSIFISSENYITETILNDWRSLEQWLDVKVVAEKNYGIKITFEYERAESEVLVA